MTIEERLDNFKVDLKDNTMSNLQITRRHFSFGTPYIFDKDESKYYKIKEKIADKFLIHTDSVKMVGSAKLGFSIAPHKLWKPLNDESDIDMVIISNDIFDLYWKELFEFNNIDHTSRTEEEDKQYKKFIEYFFRGWIRPDKFPFSYSKKKEWFEFFKSISYKEFGEKKITGAIYRENYFFEKYHESNIKNLRDGGLL
ncbi:hypothetical protein [Clostridium estertheticum]|uniref:Uncharacterized protein n=1 Tax=Clostridium estertheticum subsp. estertheticum TaxID=1552 RepID=A0A1J0GEG1_9CLOT|nr:hypothetical protein [Clostridium estertheticum]APC39647.1 hypothetical protein A7L45_05985 [Clostridium estertheticum subsp. estertheticum]MBZ9614317.1 hypothetical protein [Clostridium estertheticum subsp. laramiense]WAG74254.1 hypothetical protein LL032_02005 [Clostridium estertheticum]